MPTIILASSYDSITLYGDDPYASGYVYRNETLTSWYELPEIATDVESRPNDFGAYGWERLYAEAAKPQISGTFVGSSYLDAAVARNRLTGLYAAGLPVTMTVIDERGTFSRTLNVVAANVPWTSTAIFEFTLGTIAVDPRRYGIMQTLSTGLPTSSSGLVWPLGTDGTTYAWTGTPYASTSVQRDRSNNVLRTNLIPTPDGRANWAFSGASSAAPITDNAFTSRGAFRLNKNAAGGFVITNLATVTGGATYSASLEGRHSVTGSTVRLTVRFRNASAAETYVSAATVAAPTGAVAALSGTFTAPADAVDAVLFWDIQSGAATGTVDVGSAYLSTASGAYFDGNSSSVIASTSYSWTGTTNLSTSIAKVNGVTTRTNYSTNPNAESGTSTGYSTNQYGPAGSISTTTDRSHAGTRSFKYTAVGGGNGEGISFTIPNGQRYASVWVYNPSVGGMDHLGITGLPNPVGQSQTAVTRTTNRDQWTRLSLDMGSTVGGLAVVYNDDAAASAGSVFYWDDVLIGDTGDYFDGNSASTGLYFNWGTVGSLGRVSFVNTGNAPSSPLLTVSGGTIANGFRITEIETGREITYGTAVAATDVIALDSKTKTVTINGSGSFTQRLTSRRWPSVPAKATRTYQFTPLGATTGTPILTLNVATADL